MVLTVCLNPTLQKTLVFNNFTENQVNRTPEYYLSASGKGVNVSRVLSQLGHKVCHLTWTGGPLRRLFAAHCRQAGFRLVAVDSGAAIRFCYTVINKANRSTTEMVEEGEHVGPQTEERIMRAYRRLIKRASAVIISGSKAPGFSGLLYPDMVRLAKTLGKTVLLDYRGPDLTGSLSFKPDFIKPNLAEFTQTFLTGHTVDENQDISALEPAITAKIREIYDQYQTVPIISHGAGKVFYIERDRVRSQAPLPIKPLNTIGSGDALAAGFMAAYLQTGNIGQALRNGLDCARRNALQILPGTLG